MEILPQLVLNSLIAGSLYALLAMSFNLIYGATKFFNFAHGSMGAIGAYAAFFATKDLGLDLPLGIATGILVAGACGFLLDKSLFAPLRNRRASNMVLLIASLGVFTALQAVIAILFSTQFQTFRHTIGRARVFEIFSPSHWPFGGGVLTEIQLWLIGAAPLVCVGLWLLLKRTTFGKAVRAVSDDEEVAKIVGINTEKIIGHIFLLGSAIAGLAGVLVGIDLGIEPTMGLQLFLRGVIAAIIGGIGNVYGGALGGLFLGFVENFGIWKISGEWKDAIAFALLIIFLIFRPKGILKK